MPTPQPFTHALASQRITRGFSAHSLRASSLPLGHLLNVDHFVMSEPTFPPHPHAGFSAVTLMLPWSPGGFVNRDSRGDRSRITPGTLHWTLAGSGVVHEEIPETPGVACEGLQLFVKLPEAEELRAPERLHLALDELPALREGRSSARVLVGALGALRSPVPPHGGTTLAHVHVEAPLRLELAGPARATLVVLRGQARVTERATGAVFEGAAHTATALEPGALVLDGAFDGLLVHGAPMPSAPTFRGPFCMFAREHLGAAVERFRAGAMGHLEPSPVAWLPPG